MAFLNDLYKYREGKPNKKILNEALEALALLMAPFTPHTAEEIWEMLGNNKNGKAFVSIGEWPKARNEFIDPKLELSETLVDQTIDDIRKIIRLVGKKPKKIHIYTAPLWKYKIYNIMKKGVKDKRGALSKIMKNPEIRKHGKDAVHFCEEITGAPGEPPEILSQEEEYSTMNESTDLIRKEIGAEKVHVWNEKDPDRYDPHKKSRNAKPMKPAIFVE